MKFEEVNVATDIHSQAELNKERFAGDLPAFSADSIGQAYSLALDNNNFTGTLPDSYNSLANLSTLYLQNNQLTGPLPDSWGSPLSFGMSLTAVRPFQPWACAIASQVF